MYSTQAWLVTLFVSIACSCLLGRFGGREREKDGVVAARQPFRITVDNGDACSVEICASMWPVFYRNAGNLVFTFRVSLPVWTLVNWTTVLN